MRSIEQIKNSIAESFMRNESIAEAYGFKPGESFMAHFSKISIESLLFYVFAASVWVMENLFSELRKEIDEKIDTIKPHRPKWYRDMVLKYMDNVPLVEDTDYYDTSGMTEAVINKLCIIKHAVAVESRDGSMLTIKVAGEKEGKRSEFDKETGDRIQKYILRFKDAGVKIDFVNVPADIFNCKVTIYYDPLLVPEHVRETCETAIKVYIENLPFNGEYTNQELVNILQKIDGVKIPVLDQVTSSVHGSNIVNTISLRYTPIAGYFKLGKIHIDTLPYE